MNSNSLRLIVLPVVIMCAGPGSFAQSVNYDLNNDGREDAADVTFLVNHLLGRQETVDTHEYVDLGLPSGTLWATCNIGAGKPEESGLYFAWGETVGYSVSDGHDFSWTSYKWCSGSSSTMTKYCSDSKYGTVDSKTTLDSSDDAASANWSSKWRIPTQKEWSELSSNCKLIWTTLNGVCGYKAVASNGEYIFLPAAGFCDGTSLKCAESPDFYGCYWSSTLRKYYSTDAMSVNFNSSTGGVDYYDNRYRGFTVRAVR